ncbi:uncharacterized protein LOC123257231 [Drosophila ananassae]|uniref:uncharacterized protein LOC123257231 n=1 Tax=Drosophila ananassae TaxID=7217 RepID=UPI001CFF67AA|nr:uncharacterized protein LOC123257231 [Drosophila ananassae]
MLATKISWCCSTFAFSMRLGKSPTVNPYFVFLDHFRNNLQKRGICQLKPTVINKVAGIKWRKMTPAQKSVFIEIAQINRSRMNTTIPRLGLPVGGVKRCLIKKVPRAVKETF